MKTRAWIILSCTLLLAACATGSRFIPAGSPGEAGMVSGAEVLVLRFHTADGQLARTLRVQPSGTTAWQDNKPGAKAAKVSVWLERGGSLTPFGAGGAGSAQVDPDEFVVGPGDVLDINVWKHPELSRQTPVRPDGRLTMPLLGVVQAAGLTTNQLRDALTAGFNRFISSAELTVAVAQVHSYQVFVQGQVTRPGAYPMTGRTTLVQAIGLAGGFTQFAARGRIIILRPTAAGTERREADYDKIVAGKIPDVTLRPGDTIVVP
jgi:polysaccharide export outer membrane protein